MSSVITVAAELAPHSLPIPALVYGVIALVLFFILLLVVWSFRDVANRHAPHRDPEASAHAAAAGATTHGGHGKQHD
ncbi:hypothetical protein [Gryllotalpicola sp.]|uniref:hypothetical protein n=1 Tax=Gryllotalpicola sp. TaxID=1932787 RepID=UPI0026284F23|nr:hypothetical protein [Gryllotalpicola sp.]